MLGRKNRMGHEAVPEKHDCWNACVVVSLNTSCPGNAKGIHFPLHDTVSVRHP
jgi:hypothetical protein